jgi:hypothetical protein
MLRLGLRSARVAAEWVNIWEEPAAAAQVRAPAQRLLRRCVLAGGGHLTTGEHARQLRRALERKSAASQSLLPAT